MTLKLLLALILLFSYSPLAYGQPCIKHATQSVKPDNPAFEISSGEWNACHNVEDGAIGLSKLDTDVATQAELDAAVAALGTSDFTLSKQDPSIIFNAGQAGDTKFWSGVIDNNDGVDNDTYQIGTGIVPGTGSKLTITNSGRILPVESIFLGSGKYLLGTNVAFGYHSNAVTAHVMEFTTSSADNPHTFIRSDGAGILACRNGINPCTARFYATFTDLGNRENFAIIPTIGTGFELKAETAGTGGDNLDITLTPAGTGRVVYTGQAAATGTRYLCIDTAGKIASSATACSGT